MGNIIEQELMKHNHLVGGEFENVNGLKVTITSINLARESTGDEISVFVNIFNDKNRPDIYNLGFFNRSFKRIN